MENVSSNFNAIKSPAPNVVSSEKKPQKRTIKRPNVGVVNPSKISQTPITDNLVMKKNENPRTIYKLSTKKYEALDLNNTISLFILIKVGPLIFKLDNDVGFLLEVSPSFTIYFFPSNFLGTLPDTV